MVACVQVHVMHRCGRVQLRLVTNALGALTSNHTQSLPMAGKRCWRLNRDDPSRLIATSRLQVDFGPALITNLPPILTLRRMQGLITETAGFGALSHQPPNVWFAKNQASCGEQGKHPEVVEQSIWQQFLSDPTLPRDRLSKSTPRHPDCRHNKSQVGGWLNNQHQPAWVDLQLATSDAGMKRPPASVSTSVHRQRASGRLEEHEDHLEVENCWKLCDDGPITDAVDSLNLLVQRGRHVDSNLYYVVLKRCIARKDLVLGRRIHALTIKSGYDGDAFLATHLVSLYASTGRLQEAMRVFTRVSTPDSYNWATIIFAYARHGEAGQAIRLYRQMRESTTLKPTDRIFVAVLKACAAAGDLVAGKEVHAHILESPGKPNIFVQNGLVNMYASCGSLQDARSVFGRVADKNVVTWTAMIAGYAEQGMGQEALSLYSTMRQDSITPNSVTFVCLLQACASVGVRALHQGKQLHAQIEERGLQGDVVLGGSLVNMYAKCGILEDARTVFDRVEDRNVVTWNAMLAGYAKHDMGQEALSLYSSMQQEGITTPNSVTFVSLLQACASVGVGALHEGKQLHAQIKEQGLQDHVVVGGSLVNMYAKCGGLGDARSVFDRLPGRNVVTCNAMLAGYSRQGMGQESLSLYSSMQQEGITPNSVTFVCLLQACASIGVGALDQGKQLHAQIEERGLQDDVALGGSLVNMYVKCGSLEDARSIFEQLPARNVVTWTAIIAGYTQQGMGQEALVVYSRMQQEGLTPPDSVAFVCLLQACAIVAALPLGKQLHAQIVERGLQSDPGVGAALVHMYAKCGSMFDSQQVFDSLPERTIEAASALIGGYTRQGDSQIVFDLVHRMRLEGIQPDGIMFLSVLTVCSHVGLVDKGRKYFEAMTKEYGISPTAEHYRCMIDLLGRAGHLDEALWMAKTMPFPPNSTMWLTLLGACQKWNNVEIGQQAFEFAVSLDEKDAASYVLMSNIYATAQMWEGSKEMQARRVKSGAWKKPGQSWTDMDGVVHTFAVGDKKHPESESLYARLEQLAPK